MHTSVILVQLFRFSGRLLWVDLRKPVSMSVCPPVCPHKNIKFFSDLNEIGYVKADVKQMIYIAVLCNSRITAEPLYNTPLFIGPYAVANNTALLAWRPSQGTKLYCLVNRGTLGVNNLPRVVAWIMPRPLDHESNALPLHYRVCR